MAGKTKRMSQIKQLLRLHHEGKGKKEIARILGISRNTVKSYLEKAAADQMDIPALLRLEEPILEARLHAGNPSYKENQRYGDLTAKTSYLLKELKDGVGVTRRLLWEEYREEFPQGYGYTQFCHHLRQQKVAANPSMVMPHKAGDKLYIDFAGKTMSYVDRSTGEIVKCQVFVACLPFSDYGFAMAVRSQSVEDFLYALRCCLEDFGGAPALLFPDNLKSAIVKANPYEPDINRALEDFANHYGTTTHPARVRKPKDKALVENQVKLIYNRVYARLRKVPFFDLPAMNKAIKEKVRDHNQTRMQQKNYCRQERFLSAEKPLLKPLPEQAFEIKYYRTLTVGKNNHIWLQQDKHYYSVPYRHTGVKVKVIYTRSVVHIYVKGECVAVHPRVFYGTYTTQPDHLCSAHRHYLDRSPDYYMRKVSGKGSEINELFKLIFAQDKHPEQLYNTCNGLLNLQRKTEGETFNKACAMAIEAGNYGYHFVRNIIKNKMIYLPQETEEQPLPEHKNVRGKSYYKQTLLNFDTNETN